MSVKVLNFSTIISPEMGDKYLYLTYYVHLVEIKELIDCKNPWSGKL